MATRKQKVVLYTSPICFHCEKAKQFFATHNISFTEYDIFADKKRAEEMIELSGQKRVPVITIDGDVFSGFDEKKIAKVLL